MLKVTIITVTFNSAKYLQDCLDSVQEQDYSNIEHIIIDGQSTDGTKEIILRNEQLISTWVSEADDGMYHAINKGILLATGDVIGILNSDDVLENNLCISDIVKAFIEEKVSVVYGDLKYVSMANPSNILRIWKGKSFKRSRFITGWMPAHPTFYIKKNLVDEFGGYESHFKTAADYEFMARYLFKHKVSAYYLPKYIVRMRSGGQSNRTVLSRLRANHWDYLAMKKNKIGFPFLVSILKPLSKLHQFKKLGSINFFG